MFQAGGGLLNGARGREGAFPVTVRGQRERVFHLSAAATNMPAHLFTLSLVPASSANSYRNILAGGSLFSFFTKDLSVCAGVCVCTCTCVCVGGDGRSKWEIQCVEKVNA